ncbi:MAG: enoyl-CoA hydratase/isomerase family protein [Acidimicrobiaceae bacterium]|nr:enoyl-CoA hydratase/isomerase family protein [Acidimicrobiaceae bacterium]
MSPSIRYQVDDGIAVITIDRPEKRNAMTFAVLDEFLAAVARAGRDEEAVAVVMTGAGGAFCAGTDLSDLASRPTNERGRRDGTPTGWPLQLCPKPVVAAVDGPAVGMGAEFATQCDVRVASNRARFAWNFVHRGLVPDTGAASWLLPRQIGLSTALRLVLSGEFLSAEEALELGFVIAVVEPDAVVEAAIAEARRLSQGSPFAARLVKELMYRGLESGIADHLSRNREAMAACFASEDHREGVAAFLERRPARFVGR